MTIYDVNINLVNFPNSGHELVTENEDGSYTILINARLSCEAQLEAYNHAMRHIVNGDFDNETGDVQKIESQAHENSRIREIDL